MDDELKAKIENILKELPCPRGCLCYGRTPENLCNARSFGLHSLLECLEPDAKNCMFAVAFGGSYFCKCPARLRIAQVVEGEGHGPLTRPVSV